MPFPRLTLLLLVALVGGRALWGDYVYDDELLVVRNPAVTGFWLRELLGAPLLDAAAGYWRPLTLLALAVGHAAGGALGVHLLALVLHGSNTLLVHSLARDLLGPPRAAWFAAAVFAVHPVQVEALAWCAAINDPLWSLFALLAIRAVRRGAASGAWQIAGATTLAILAKENGVAVVPLAAAAAASGPTHRPAWRRLGLALGAGVLVAAGLRVLVHGGFAAAWPAGPAVAAEFPRGLTAPLELLARHLVRLVVPFDLSPFGSLPTTVDLLPTLAGAGLLLGAGATLWRTWSRRSPAQRLGLALLLLPLLPTLLLWQRIGAYPIGERYLYLATAGLGLWLAPWLAAGRRPWFGAALLLALAGLSVVQIGTWRDQASLVAQGRRAAPDDPNLHVMAGDLAQPKAMAGDAAARTLAHGHYTAALRLAPPGHRAVAGARLGLAYLQLLGGNGPAERSAQVAAFQAAVDADPARPAAWTGLGLAMALAGRSGDAERHFRRALELDPRHSEAWGNLGNLLRQQGRTAEARRCLQQALDCNPENLVARQLLEQLR